MPYHLRFTKPLTIVDRGRYRHPSSVGGDQVIEQLLPALEVSYGRVESRQEGDGWQACFEQNGAQLSVDVHASEERGGAFEVQLTSRTRKRLFGTRLQDTAELESLRELVADELRAWHVGGLAVERVEVH